MNFIINKDLRLTIGESKPQMKLIQSKKGVIDQLAPMVIGLVAIGITIAIAFLIMAEVASNASVTADTNASAAVDKVQGAMDDIPGWLPIIVITIIGALLIGLVSIFRGKR